MNKQHDFLALGNHAILITGASSGIGRATAIAASQQGAKVAIVARRMDQLEETLSLLDGEGHLAIVCDVNDPKSLSSTFQQASAELGLLSGVVHAAGVHAVTPLRVMRAEQVAKVFETNVTSALMVAKAFRSPKVRAPHSSIVLLSSAVALTGEAGVSAYAASKAAIASIGRSLALELAGEDIRVNSIAAGIVETPLTDGIRAKVGSEAWESIRQTHPLGLGVSVDVANAALYLLSQASRWVTGSTLVVDGGYTAH